MEIRGEKRRGEKRLAVVLVVLGDGIENYFKKNFARTRTGKNRKRKQSKKNKKNHITKK